MLLKFIQLAFIITILVAGLVGMRSQVAKFVTPSSVFAQEEASDSAENTTDETDENGEKTTEKLKERIERIVGEKSEQIKGVINELNQNRRGTIGQVVRISQEALTFENVKGTHIVSLDESVALLKSGDEIGVDDVAVGDWVVVMGSLNGEDTFDVDRVLVSTNTLRPRTQIVELGTITDISRNEITLKPRNESLDPVTLDLSRNTDYEDINGEEVALSDITEETQALVVGYEDDEDKTTLVIRILMRAEDIEEE